MTTFATWNLHHMGIEASIPPEVVAVIERVRPDVLVLTEYVDRGGRGDFVAALKRLDYWKPKCSDRGREPRQNQVLVASLEAREDGRLQAPKVDEAARTNFLHRVIPKIELNVVGFRVPHYQGENPVNPEKPVNYWQQFKEMALGEAGKRFLFIGDFNIGDKGIDESGRRAVRHLVGKGFRLAGEVGGRDRALLSPRVRLKSLSVIENAGGYRLTGSKGEKALSDHPMLIVDVE